MILELKCIVKIYTEYEESYPVNTLILVGLKTRFDKIQFHNVQKNINFKIEWIYDNPHVIGVSFIYQLIKI